MTVEGVANFVLNTACEPLTIGGDHLRGRARCSASTS